VTGRLVLDYGWPTSYRIHSHEHEEHHRRSPMTAISRSRSGWPGQWSAQGSVSDDRVRTQQQPAATGLRSRLQRENQDRRGGAGGEDGHLFGMPITSRTSTRQAGGGQRTTVPAPAPVPVNRPGQPSRIRTTAHGSWTPSDRSISDGQQRQRLGRRAGSATARAWLPPFRSFGFDVVGVGIEGRCDVLDGLSRPDAVARSVQRR